jgi:hypothetical protein
MKLWAGLAELRADPTCKDFRRFADGKGAFVWVVAWEESQSTFKEKVRVMSESLDCILYGLEDVDLLEEKMKTEGYPEEFINMRETANRQPEDTIFGPFHVWCQDDRI